MIQVKTIDGETWEFERGSMTVGVDQFTFKYPGGFILFPFTAVLWIKQDTTESVRPPR